MTNDETKPTHLDLFSGIGGFALAAGRAGLRTIGFCEIDGYASAVLRKHWPDVPNFGDIRNVRGIRADLVTGGFPCQPFSVAGKRRGAGDDRALWPEMLRVIAEVRPGWVLAENVPGIIGMELDRVLSDLEGIGYATGTLVVPACAVDARHRRDRVWIVGHCDGGRREGARLSIRRKRQGATDKDPDAGGPGSVVADAERAERRADHDTRRYSGEGQNGEGQAPSGLGEFGEVVPDSGRALLERRGGQPARTTTQWPVEPGVGRVAHGIPRRVDRLRCLGNAIVPQVAEVLLRGIRTQIINRKCSRPLK